MKIIKTNLSVNPDTNQIHDHQSYVQEEESWESFVKAVKEGLLFSKNRSFKVENIKHDDFHLSCDVYNGEGMLTKHFAHIEGRVITD